MNFGLADRGLSCRSSYDQTGPLSLLRDFNSTWAFHTPALIRSCKYGWCGSTPPGKQAQVDWGHLGCLDTGGERRQVWGFAITLGHRRRMWAQAALHQKPARP